MANHVQLALQTKIFDLLRADATLQGLLGGATPRIYDWIPDNPTYPLVAVGDIVCVDFGTHTSSGFEATLSIHVFTQSAGRKDALTIMARVYQLLHEVDLAVTNFPTLSCREASREVIREEDGKTHHGICRYRILIDGN